MHPDEQYSHALLKDLTGLKRKPYTVLKLGEGEGFRIETPDGAVTVGVDLLGKVSVSVDSGKTLEPIKVPGMHGTRYEHLFRLVVSSKEV